MGFKANVMHEGTLYEICTLRKDKDEETFTLTDSAACATTKIIDYSAFNPVTLRKPEFGIPPLK